MEVVTGPGAPSLGEFLHLVDMRAVPLISSIITLGTGITMMMFRQAGLSLLNQVGRQQPFFVRISWCLFLQVFLILSNISSVFMIPKYARIFQPEGNV